MIYPATPQEFQFGGRTLTGELIAFTGGRKRRKVLHEFPKQSGALIEDMGISPRTLVVQLEFIGENAAREYQDFENAVIEKPKDILIHPIAGRWQAFCDGADHDVAFSRAVNEIKVRVTFTESSFDAGLPRLPDPASAAQNVTAQQGVFEQGVALYMGALTKAAIFRDATLNAVDSAVSLLDTVASPIAFMQESITSSAGTTSAIAIKVNGIATAAETLGATIDSYVTAASDVFDGESDLFAQFDEINTLLGVVADEAQATIDVLIAASDSPAGAADSVGDTQNLLAYCYDLADAIEAARPPVILYTVPSKIDLLTLAQRRYRKRAAARAQDILALNRIPNPAAIPAGTVLRIPSK